MPFTRLAGKMGGCAWHLSSSSVKASGHLRPDRVVSLRLCRWWRDHAGTSAFHLPRTCSASCDECDDCRSDAFACLGRARTADLVGWCMPKRAWAHVRSSCHARNWVSRVSLGKDGGRTTSSASGALIAWPGQPLAHHRSVPCTICKGLGALAVMRQIHGHQAHLESFRWRASGRMRLSALVSDLHGRETTASSRERVSEHG